MPPHPEHHLQDERRGHEYRGCLEIVLAVVRKQALKSEDRQGEQDRQRQARPRAQPQETPPPRRVPHGQVTAKPGIQDADDEQGLDALPADDEGDRSECALHMSSVNRHAESPRPVQFGFRSTAHCMCRASGPSH